MAFMYSYWIILGVLILQIARIALRRHRIVSEAIRQGCLPPASAPNQGVFGLRTLYNSMQATKKGHGPQWIHNTMNSIGKDVHTVRARIFDYEVLITRDTENLKAIFASKGADFDIGPHRERTFKSVFGLGVMTARGEAWKHSRGLVRPQFARTNVANLRMFEEHFQSMLKRLPVREDGWTADVDLQPLFQNFTLDVGTEFLYGQSIWSQDPEKRVALALNQDKDGPDVAGFGHHLDMVKQGLDRQGALAKYSWLLLSSQFNHHRQELWKFVDYFVNQVIKQKSTGKRERVSNAMQGKFVLLNELAGETQNPLELRNETLNVLHASRDTTAALMGWVMLFLSRDEEVQMLLRHEVKEAFPGNGKAEISFNNLLNLQYMQAVINETIRMVGIIPMNERVAVQDTVLPRGGGTDGLAPVFVPRGQQILIPTYSLQHREDIWGKDHNEFRPARWQYRQHAWDFLPFGSGVRQCLGQQFARTQTMYVVARFLEEFETIQCLRASDEKLHFHHTIENKSGTGVHVRMRITK